MIKLTPFSSYLDHRRDGCTRKGLFQPQVLLSDYFYRTSAECQSSQLHPGSMPKTTIKRNLTQKRIFTAKEFHFFYHLFSKSTDYINRLG